MPSKAEPTAVPFERATQVIPMKPDWLNEGPQNVMFVS